MKDRLAEFLAQASGRPYQLGQFDCGLWLADWYIVATGRPDPASAWRGTTYQSSAIKRVRRIIATAGLKRTKHPQRGDIGLVSVQKGHLVGGIFSGTHWYVLIDDRGLGAVLPNRLRFVAAWRIDS